MTTTTETSELEVVRENFVLSQVSTILKNHSRTSKTTFTIRSSYVVICAIIRGCSGFASIEVQNPEYHQMGTPRASLNPTKPFTWNLKVEPKTI